MEKSRLAGIVQTGVVRLQPINTAVTRTKDPGTVVNRSRKGAADCDVGGEALSGNTAYRTFAKSASNSVIFPSGKKTMILVLAIGSKLS